ncbi:MAG: aldolase [Moorellales bacterium]
MLGEFQRVGRDLFLTGLVSSHAGNLSVRLGDRIVITRRGARLGHLRRHDLVETGLYEDDSGIALASSEIRVHRAIYQETSALAVVHAHPPFTVTLSLTREAVVPVDSEASYLLHRVPVLSAEKTIGSAEVAALVAPALRDYKIVILRGHGTFAVGQFLEEALQWTTCLEAASKVLYLLELSGQERREYRQGVKSYERW